MEIENLFDYLKTESEEKKESKLEEDCCENKELVTKCGQMICTNCGEISCEIIDSSQSGDIMEVMIVNFQTQLELVFLQTICYLNRHLALRLVLSMGRVMK